MRDQSETRHTPGPWRVREDRQRDGSRWIMAPCGICVAEVQAVDCADDDTDPERDANAELVAAAEETAAERDRFADELRTVLPDCPAATQDRIGLVLAGAGTDTRELLAERDQLREALAELLAAAEEVRAAWSISVDARTADLARARLRAAIAKAREVGS